VVDGVGYPAVGSICGVSNASVAARLGAPVLLVGKKGVGDAVDSFNMNSTYMRAGGASVMGALFNRLPLDGYYSREKCMESVSKYFEQVRVSFLSVQLLNTLQYQPNMKLFGFIPENEGLVSASAPPLPPSTATGAAVAAEAAAGMCVRHTISCGFLDCI
jgi:hypothetical protein